MHVRCRVEDRGMKDEGQVEVGTSATCSERAVERQWGGPGDNTIRGKKAGTVEDR